MDIFVPAVLFDRIGTMTEHKHEEPHLAGYGMYFTVWLILVMFTGITVAVSYLDMYKYTIFTAMLIASVKVTLVVMYFMHIRFESKLYPIMIFTTLATYAIFIGLTFSDYLYR